MPTTFANSIDGNDIFARRAECDAAGNVLSTTYATKSELPDGVPAVTSSDDNKVLKASYSGGTGSYSWQTESGGSDAVFVTWDDTSAGWTTMWTQVQAALSGNKDVFLKDGFCVAELVATNPSQVNFRGLANSTGVPPKITYNYYYLQPSFAHKAVQDQYVLPSPGSGSDGQVLGLVPSDDPPYREPGWVTVSPGPTYSAGTGIDITNNVISADTTVLATKSELPDGVPTVTSSDNNKVLKASYSGGVASYSWQTESGGGGGGGADWAAEQGEPGYISNKPVPKTLTAGTGVSIQESPSTITVSCNVTAPVQDVTVDGTSVVSNGVAAITMPTPPTVDQTYSAVSTNAQSGAAVADAIGNLPTNLSAAQIQALKEALGCDADSFFKELYYNATNTNDTAGKVYSLSEPITNFMYAKITVDNMEYTNAPLVYEIDVQHNTTTCQWNSPLRNGNVNNTINLPTCQLQINNDGNLVLVARGLTYNTYPSPSFTDGANRGMRVVRVVGIFRIASN